VLTRSVGRLPLAGALALAAVVYVGFGLVLPLGAGASKGLLVLLNVMGVALAWTITLAWLLPRIEATHRRHLLEWTTDLRRLSAQEFEWIVGEVFRREGWNVAETGREAAADGNVDLRLRSGNRQMLAQCKRWSSTAVGVDEVRKLAGTLMREGLPGNAGTLVTLSHFTGPAQTEAKKLGIHLIDNADLVRRLEQVRRPEPCPICATSMVLDKSARGWWYRCPRWKDGCRGKRDLGTSPGRAVELLRTN
jgi:HJR/Mrr/RecB family endonuclease